MHAIDSGAVGRLSRITTEDVDPGGIRAYCVYQSLLERVDCWRRLLQNAIRPSRWHRMTAREGENRTLAVLDSEIVALRNARYPEADAARFDMHVKETRVTAYNGARRSLDELDPEECAAENHERMLSLRRRIEGASPELLRSEADADRRLAGIAEEEAAVLESEANRIERLRVVAVARLNGGAA